MMNTIMIFDDSTAIIERGVGYFEEEEYEQLGSIEVAFKEVFKEDPEWTLKFYCPDNEENTDPKDCAIAKIKLTTQTMNNYTTAENLDKVFVLLDASWEQGLMQLKQSILDWINGAQKNNLYVLVYSAVDLSLAMNTKEQIKQVKNEIKTTIFNRSDSKWLYRQMKRKFEEFKEVAIPHGLQKE